MPKTITVINCGLTRMTKIKNYVSKQKTTHVETVALLSKLDVDKHAYRHRVWIKVLPSQHALSFAWKHNFLSSSFL